MKPRRVKIQTQTRQLRVKWTYLSSLDLPTNPYTILVINYSINMVGLTSAITTHVIGFHQKILWNFLQPENLQENDLNKPTKRTKMHS